jgi:large subunit ribosomal protein L29
MSPKDEQKPEKLRALSIDELDTKLKDTQEELMNLRFQQVTGQLSDASRLRVLRRQVARMQTIMQERNKAEAVKGEA